MCAGVLSRGAESCGPFPQVSAQMWPQQHFIKDNAAQSSPLLPELLDGHVLLTVLLHHLGKKETLGSQDTAPFSL